jgi:hypothetical protein
MMAENELLKKLQVKSGQLVVLNAPDDFAEHLKPLPEGITLLADLSEQADNVLVFVRSKDDIDKYGPYAIGCTVDDGMLWFAYPKGSSKIETDINRDKGWDALRKESYRPVRQISIDGTWSALRFRHQDQVKPRK